MKRDMSKTSERATRFPIRAALRYRLRGERIWRQGVTENISTSGVLFRTDQTLSPGTLLDISFTLPMDAAGAPGAKVACHGVIVRAVEQTLYAARISRSRLLRPWDADDGR